MVDVRISDKQLKEAACLGMDEFISVFTNSIRKAIGGELNVETMAMLNGNQITLLAYEMLRDEVMDGGFIQLIHNGLGGFIFRNPFAKVMKQWGLQDLCRLINHGHKLYSKYHEEIEQECSDDEFMAMFEKHPKFDDLDDDFVEHEEEWTAAIAHYVDSHIEDFAIIEKIDE